MLAAGLFMAGAKLLAAAKEIVIAWEYGVSRTVDVYLFSLTIATWIPVTLVSVAIITLVPRLVALVSQEEARRRFLAETNGTAVILSVVVSFMAISTAPWLIDQLASGFSSDAKRQTLSMVWQMLPLVPLTIFAGLLSLRLQARGRHEYGFLEGMPALGIALCILTWPLEPGSEPLVIGTIVGSAIQLGLLARLIHKYDRPLSGVALRHRSPHWLDFYSGVVIMVIGQTIISVTPLIDQIYAAGLKEGAISTLGYANRFIALALTLGAMTIGRALLPVVSEATAKGHHEVAWSYSLKWSWLMFIIGWVATTIGWIIAPWAVSLLLERGAFSAGDTAEVSRVLRYSLLQLPFYFAGIAVMQYFAALKTYRPLLIAAVLTAITRWLLNDILTDTYDVAGIALATAGCMVVWWMSQLTYALVQGRPV